MQPNGPETRSKPAKGSSVHYKCCAKERRIIELTPKTEAFAQAYKKGRMGIYAVNLTKSKTLTYMIIYGHTGGRIGPKEAAAAKILIKIAHAEMEAQLK